MTPKRKNQGLLSRRQALRGISACAAGGVLGVSSLLQGCRAPAREQAGLGNRGAAVKPRFLIVVGAMGGASIIDSFLAIREGESTNPSLINAFPNAMVQDIAGSSLRAVDYSGQLDLGTGAFPFTTSQSAFVNKHKADMMVATWTTSSVNHVIGQKRSITGGGAWKGRTLQECVAMQYGAGAPLPNVNMSNWGFLEKGTDPNLPSWVYGEPVTNPVLWPLGLDGARGIKNLPTQTLVDRARSLRNDALDPESAFVRTFGPSETLQRWSDHRASVLPALEAKDLITALNVLPDSPPGIPLTEYGLGNSPDAQKVRAAFPNFFFDPLEAQCALAFLLLKNGVSVSVTISPTFNFMIPGGSPTLANVNLQLAFDFSHGGHRAGQAWMWNRVLSMIDRLVDLLKGEEFDASTGESFWDRSMIYVATDFGRSKKRPANAPEFGTAHDLNNGVLILSPMANGNTVLGGVDKNTALTYGFDPVSGIPDTGRTMSEKEIYSGILGAMQVDTTGSGLPAIPCMRG